MSLVIIAKSKVFAMELTKREIVDAWASFVNTWSSMEDTSRKDQDLKWVPTP